MKKVMTLILLGVILPLNSGSVFAQWSHLRIARGWDLAYGVTIGKGRNDDTVRIYFAGDSSGGTTWPVLYEYTYQGGAWVKTSSFVDYAGYLTVADARNDSVQRVYYNRFGPVELSFVSGNWVRDTLPRFSTHWGIACGSGRNDGRRRLYVPGYIDGHMYEYDYMIDHWVITDMGACGSGSNLKGVVLGQGRNDGLIRIYTAHTNGHIYEYSDSSGNWHVVDMGSIVPGVGLPGFIAIGDGRNDGVQRIYVSVDTLGPTDKGIIAEYSYEGGNWVIRWIGDNWLWFWPVAVGRGRNDSLNRVYGAGADSHIYEFRYQTGQWVKADIGAGETNIYGPGDLMIGDGRGDGVVRVYMTNDADLYEFTWEGSGVEVNRSEFYTRGKEVKLVPNRPNPFRDRTKISYQLPERMEVSLQIYDCTGRQVKRLQEGVQTAGWHRFEWNGYDESGRILPAGVYLCHLTVGSEERPRNQTIKMIFTK